MDRHRPTCEALGTYLVCLFAALAAYLVQLFAPLFF
jgi:hypothetical protein